MACLTCLHAQIPDSVLKKLNKNVFLPDSVTKRTALSRDTPKLVTTDILYSKDSLDAPVDYGSKDSLIFDNVNNLVYLYGAAYVNYQSLKLTADYIVIDLKNNIATAEPSTDSTGKKKGIPKFKDETQDFNALKMRYNFRTQKGVVYDVTTKYQDSYVHGGLSKFVSTKGDSSKRSDIVYSKDAIFTSCNADHPHFGLHSLKQKVIPNKLIIVGPSYLTIGDIPMPLGIPFAAFPLTSGKQTGLIFPQNYEYSPLWGYGLKNIGWYVPISDNFDATVTADAYVRGTWGLRTRSNYLKTYKYSGNFELGYQSIITENEKAQILREPSWSIQLSHSQDQRANPLFNFNANVNIQGSKSKTFGNYQGTNRNDFQSATRSQLSSSASFTRTFPGKPFSLSASTNHSQNLATRDFSFSPLDMDFRMQTIFPLKRKKRVGEEKWYEKISLQYGSSMRNRVQTKDSLITTAKGWENFQTGIKHDLSSSVNFNLFKYFNLSPNVSYSQTWYFKQITKSFNANDIRFKIDTLFNPRDSNDYTLRRDTVNYGKVDTLKHNGFYPVQQMSAGVSLSTRIFGTMQFKKGYLRGLRHTITPSLGLSFSPNYHRYEDSVQTDFRYAYLKQVYNLYENAIFGTPSASGKQAALTYSFTNLFEYKTFNKKDSTFKKGKLLENVNIAGSYNMAADSFKWSQIAMGTGTNFFKGLTTLSVQALFDPYAKDANGRRLQEFALKRNGKLLNMVNATINLNTSLSIGDIKKLFEGGSDEKDKDGKTTPKPRAVKKENSDESVLDLLESFRLSHNFSISRTSISARDTTLFSNALYTSGNIPLTKKWSITVGNIGYDFVSKQMTYPDFGFRRDLHCWEMGMNYQPLRGTYQFYLRVKPGSKLDFLKVPYTKNIGDAFRR
jgi:LptD protein